jgi:hypothetical protein
MQIGPYPISCLETGSLCFHKIIEKTEPATLMADKYRTMIPSHELSHLYFLAVRLFFVDIAFNLYFFRNDRHEFPLEFLNLIFYDSIRGLQSKTTDLGPPC